MGTTTVTGSHSARLTSARSGSTCRPRHAQVYVDGYYAGVVDDYDGVFQGLKLESGAYRIEITAPGYENLSFDVRISPGQKINYEGNLRRVP